MDIVRCINHSYKETVHNQITKLTVNNIQIIQKGPHAWKAPTQPQIIASTRKSPIPINIGISKIEFQFERHVKFHFLVFQMSLGTKEILSKLRYGVSKLEVLGYKDLV